MIVLDEIHHNLRDNHRKDTDNYGVSNTLEYQKINLNVTRQWSVSDKF
jgi:hypothetical protein